MPYQDALIDRAIHRAQLQHGVGYYSRWRTHGSSSFYPRGVVDHHDASSISSGNNGALNMIIHGGRDFPGPYGNFQLARNGYLWVVAAGRANHAGKGSWRGLSGNISVFGIEAANNGVGERWSPQMIDTYIRLVAALLDEIGADTLMTCAHREWAPNRKPDPVFNNPHITMDRFRVMVETMRNNYQAAGEEPEPVVLEEEIMYHVVKERGNPRLWAVGGGYAIQILSPDMIRNMMAANLISNKPPWKALNPEYISRLANKA